MSRAACGVLLGLSLAACGERRDPAVALALTGDEARGQAQYQMKCAVCHGAEGHGVASAPALSARVAGLSDAEIVGAMVVGRGAMRPVRLTDQEAADIGVWLRQTWGR